MPERLRVFSCGSLKNVEFGENIKEICYGAFYGCDSLSDEIKNKIRKIAESEKVFDI